MMYDDDERDLSESGWKDRVYGFAPSSRIIYDRVRSFGISCGQLSKISGVPKASIESVVYGNALITNVRFDYAWRIMRVLSLDADELMKLDLGEGFISELSD